MLRRATVWATVAALVVAMVSAGSAASAAQTGRSPAMQSPVSTSSVGQTVVQMADLSRFQPGNIISDASFYNRGTMTESEIQGFLQGKVPNCQSGYVCLKDWYDTSRTTTADAMCGAYSGGLRERASTIIYKVAQACGINPQVLIVMLQKEQGLVTHTWPSEFRYTIAMGQGCPDTAACDTRYYGFFNQVYGAAWQLKRYANPPGTSQYFTWFAPGNTWNIRWHPNESCGSAAVYVQNQATANLYYYTPYQPNSAALRAGYGEGDACSAYGNRNFYQYFTDWFGSTQESPLFGNLELMESRPGEFRVAGWAAKRNAPAPVGIHVYVGSTGTAFEANLARADVGAAYPALGNAHGFDVTVPATGPGDPNVCVYIIDNAGGAPAVLGCRAMTAKSGSPIGRIDGATGVEGGVDVSGWAIDPDAVGPTAVHLYVDSAGVAVLADADRPDLPAHYPEYGPKHGYATRLAASPGPHQVCAYAINIGPGGTTPIGCTTVTVPGSADLGRPPIGALDSVTVDGDVATAGGWAIDPDTSAPIGVHLYVGDAGTAYVADKPRPDVGNVYPAYGPDHGFVESLTLPVGTSQVCAYAINTGAGGHTSLGCRTVTVAASPPADGAEVPIGNFESAPVGGGGATVTGWTFDPDTVEPISIHVYVDGTGAAFLADEPRADVAAAYPGAGDRHGFSELVPMTAGAHQVCVYAINDGAGGHVLLGCRDLLVP